MHLTTETVQSASLPLERIDDVERCNRLPLGVLCVCNCIANNALEEGLQDTAGLFVDHCWWLANSRRQNASEA
jgi:hypothetical protein